MQILCLCTTSYQYHVSLRHLHAGPYSPRKVLQIVIKLFANHKLRGQIKHHHHRAFLEFDHKIFLEFGSIENRLVFMQVLFIKYGSALASDAFPFFCSYFIKVRTKKLELLVFNLFHSTRQIICG